MKQTIFTTDERFLLQDVIEERMVYFNGVLNEKSSSSEKKSFENSHIKPLRSALDKISRHEPSIITKSEKTSFIICINIRISEYYNELKSLTALSCLTISEQQKIVAKKMDNGKDILMKCGYEFNDNVPFMISEKFRFGDVLTAIEKLKRTDKVLLLYSGLSGYSQIVFVYEDKEYIVFYLNFQIPITEFKFESLNGQSLEDFANEWHSLITTKLKAKELIATQLNYPIGVLDFLNALLG